MAELKYQFPNRWAEIGPLLFPEPTAEQQRALSLLEQKDRDAEDHWGGSGGGSLTAGSLVAVYKDGGGSGYTPGNEGDIVNITVTAPSEVGFVYWLDATAYMQVYVQDDGTGTPVTFGWSAFIRDDTGFYIPDGWRYLHQSWPNINHAGDTASELTGTARALTSLTPGEVRHVYVHVANNSPNGAFDLSVGGTLHIKLFAVPS